MAVSQEWMDRLWDAIGESVAIDGEFAYTINVDGDKTFPCELFRIERLNEHNSSYCQTRSQTHIHFVTFEQFKEELPNDLLRDRVNYAMDNMEIFIRAKHKLRSELLYVSPTGKPQKCERCDRPYRGPALYCSLDCAVLDVLPK